MKIEQNVNVRKGLLRPVTTTCWGMEYSIHACPLTHRQEVSSIFPNVNVTDDTLVIPTCQQSDVNLVEWGADADAEKDRLLERFMEFAKHVCTAINEQGHWADYIDPCSGLPMICRENGNNVYGEVQGLVALLGYHTQNAGCCKIVLHPKWGSSVYPASMFAKAPLEVVIDAIEKAEEHCKGHGLFLCA